MSDNRLASAVVPMQRWLVKLPGCAPLSVRANTRSEARSKAKQVLKRDRLPVRAVLRKEK